MNIEWRDETIKHVRADHCPVCTGDLDTGYECTDCGYDAEPIASALSLSEGEDD